MEIQINTWLNLGKFWLNDRRQGMKKEIPIGAMIAVGVVLLAVIGFAAFKIFGGDPAASSVTPEQAKAVKQMRGAVMAQGVHRDVNGHFVDADGNPVQTNVTPNK